MKEAKDQVTKVEQAEEQPVEQIVEQQKAPVQVEAKKPKQKRAYNAKKWTFEEVKDLIRKYYETTGKLPTDEYLKRADNMPSPMTTRKYLGVKKEDWLKAIGVEVSVESKVSEAVTQNGEIIDEIVELIGEAGKIARIAENTDILKSISITKKYQLEYNGIVVYVDIDAKKLGQQNV